MTGEEKRRLLKEKYKEDLKKRKEFLESAKRLRHTQKLNDAITDLTSSLNDDTDEWIEKLNHEAAFSEAKLEMHLDEQSSTTQKLEKLAKEAETKKFSAELMVLQMKKEMGILTPDEKAQFEKLTNPPEPEVEEEAKAEEKIEEVMPEDSSNVNDDNIEDLPSDRKLGDF